jgi:hypothetical protein
MEGSQDTVKIGGGDNMMKRTLILCVMYIVISLVFFGCKKKEDGGFSNVTTPSPPKPQTYNLIVNHTTYLWIDPLTKCHYLSNSGSSTLIPRVDRMGKHICD